MTHQKKYKKMYQIGFLNCEWMEEMEELDEQTFLLNVVLFTDVLLLFLSFSERYSSTDINFKQYL